MLLLVCRLGPERLPRQRGRMLAATALAGLLFAADLALWHLGILRTRLANATLLGNVPAILFPVYGFVIARRWPAPRQLLALALAAAGAGLLAGRSFELSPANLLGDLVCVVAGLCYTGYLVTVDRARQHLGPVTTLTGAVLTGAPLLLVVAIVAGDQLRPADWAPLLLLAAGSQVIGQGLILFAVSRVTPLVVGVMLLLQPIVSAAIGWIGYHERLTIADLLGGAAIAAAVLFVREPTPRLRAKPAALSG